MRSRRVRPCLQRSASLLKLLSLFLISVSLFALVNVLVLAQHERVTNDGASGGFEKAFAHSNELPRPRTQPAFLVLPPEAAELTHYTTQPRAKFSCVDAADTRPNCTRCMPGWQGVTCSARVHVLPCTMQRCLAWSRCPKGRRLTVHVTSPPSGDVTAAWLNRTTSAEYRDMLDTVAASSRHVASADEACIHISWVDTLCSGNRCTNTWTDAPKTEALAAALAAQPGWDGGANFLVFDLSSNYQPAMPVGRGLYAASSFWAAGASFRHGHDIALPLWDKRWGRAQAGADSRRRLGARPLLLSFKGQRMFWCTSTLCSPPDLVAAVRAGGLRPAVSYKEGWVRSLARALHNGRDVIILTRCTRELEDPRLCADECAARCNADRKEYGRHDYQALLHNSTFGLVLPGITPMSYRLAETMAAGAVPVIVSDFLTIPFINIFDWSTLAVRVPEALLLQVPDILRSLDFDRVSRMRAAVADAYERCFATPGKIALCALDELELRAIA